MSWVLPGEYEDHERFQELNIVVKVVGTST